jgi:uncharacterized protein YqhQ
MRIPLAPLPSPSREGKVQIEGFFFCLQHINLVKEKKEKKTVYLGILECSIVKLLLFFWYIVAVILPGTETEIMLVILVQKQKMLQKILQTNLVLDFMFCSSIYSTLTNISYHAKKKNINSFFQEEKID